MASGSSLPPQAYTREILTAAFNWLQTQTESVRKTATTPDVLVGLFMRAQRFGESNPESDAPISSQNFMSDLRNLAEGLKQFEGPAKDTSRGMQRENHRDPRRFTASPNIAPPITPNVSANMMPNMSSDIGYFQPPIMQVQTPAPSVGVQAGLNERTLTMIHEVKAQFNLSCEAEAINMMVSLAYKSLKNLLA
jgi:hypothetical protein